MADKDAEDDGPSLELPSFGFGRKKRDRAEASHPEVPATPDPGPEVVPGAEPEVPAVPGPGQAPGDDPAPRPEIDPVVPSPPEPPGQQPEIDPLVPTAPPEPDPTPEIDPLVPSRPEWQPDTPPAPAPGPGPMTDPGDPASAAGETRVGSRLDERDPDVQVAPARGPRTLGFPRLPALPAVLLVGAVVGITAVLLTWAALRTCDVATGTASCGGGPGLLLLVAILIALTYLGGWLLRGLGIDDAGSTSFLAVGLLAVVAMLFLVDALDEWSGVLAVLVVSVVAYALSWHVTALVDAGAEQR
jgi:hypothetical protein